MVLYARYGKDITGSLEKIVTIPHKTRVLNRSGLKDSLVNIPDINADEVYQPDMKANEIYQPRMKAKKVDQQNMEANIVYQPRMKAEEVGQVGMEANIVDQQNMEANIVNQCWMKAEEVYQFGMEAETVDQQNMKIKKLVTREKACYGRWNLRDAEINKWRGDWIYFENVDVRGAKLPSELINVIEAEKCLRDLAGSYQMIK